ncbi:putative DNA binding domain-containing protein, partial [Candidatus Aminicenantes bacterium AC-335-L06]|nr:putative DNA binding domain-containing protein [Candidatus Aminicenantes bacterium AC-335-L06]
CPWDVKNFPKDILAFSNVRGGGYIIIGIEQKEGKYERGGVSIEHIKTYNQEIMLDQMSNFADPGVDFEVNFSEDKDGKKYVIIAIKEFKEIPVICKKDSEDTKKGVIYYRSTGRRPESAPVSNSYDMRDIIELAVVKMMRKKRELGFTVESSDEELFDKELEDFMKNIITKIKSRGYWKVRFRPLIYKKNRIPKLSNCKEIVKRNVVIFRGWDYPHFPIRGGTNSGLLPGNNFYEAWIDRRVHKEFWRMYQSGQFINYRALWEDWDEEDPWIVEQEKKQPMKYLGVLHTIGQITEIFEFLAGLSKEGIFKEGMNLLISLNNTMDRKLWLEDRSRIPFFYDHKTGAPAIKFQKEYTEREIIENSTELAVEAILYFFERFDWIPSKEMIKEDQKKLLRHRRFLPF